MRSQIAKSLSVDDLHGRFPAPPWECKRFNHFFVSFPPFHLGGNGSKNNNKPDQLLLYGLVRSILTSWQPQLRLLRAGFLWQPRKEKKIEKATLCFVLVFVEGKEARQFVQIFTKRNHVVILTFYSPFGFFFSLFQFLTVGSSFTLPVLACTPEEQESRVVWIFNFFFSVSKWDSCDRLPDGLTASATRLFLLLPSKKKQTNSCRLWISILVGRSFASWWRWHGLPFVCMWTLFCSFLNFLWSFYSNRNRL